MSSVLWPLCYDDDSGGSLDDDDYEAANKSVSFNLKHSKQGKFTLYGAPQHYFFLFSSDYFNFSNSLGLEFCCTVDFHKIVRQYDGKKADILKVSKTRKQIMVSWILPKNECWGNFMY